MISGISLKLNGSKSTIPPYTIAYICDFKACDELKVNTSDHMKYKVREYLGKYWPAAGPQLLAELMEV